MLSSERSYGTRDLARAVGQTRQTVRNFLRERYPAHEGRSWWKFSPEEFNELVKELKLPNPQRRYGGRRRHQHRRDR